MKSKISINFVFLMGFFLVSCNSNEQKMNPYKLCLEFYELNKHTNVEGLFNLQILGIREYSVYENNGNNRIPLAIGINNPILDTHLNLPSFSKNANMEEKKRFFARCDSLSIEYLKHKYKINTQDDIFNFYIKEIESIYLEYYRIKVPEVLPYHNIEINGYDDYIEFVLYNDKEKGINYSCYYVKDKKVLKNSVKKSFEKLPKFDDHWYYKIRFRKKI